MMTRVSVRVSPYGGCLRFFNSHCFQTKRAFQVPFGLPSNFVFSSNKEELLFISVLSILESFSSVLLILKIFFAASKSKTSDTPDAIPSMVLKNLGADVCEPLSLILRRSLETGEVSRLFRCAIVSPVHKKGNRTEPANKRPVSLTSMACKLLESILASALLDNIETQNLIHDNQYAYRSRRSTTLRLLDTQYDWPCATNENESVDVIYYDFRSAVESVTQEK